MRRELRPRAADEDVLDLASNDYLGLARDPRVIERPRSPRRRVGRRRRPARGWSPAAPTCTRTWRQGSPSFVGTAAALVFSSGYLANLGAVTALAGDGALVVSDALNHASLVDACRLARGDVVVTPHRDVDAVDAALAGRAHRARGRRHRRGVLRRRRRRAARCAAPGRARARGAARRRRGARARRGRAGGSGAAREAGISGEPDVVVTVTLSKSLGSQGGAVLGDPVVVEHLVNTARAFIFDTGLAPAAAAGALAALGVLRADPALAGRRPGPGASARRRSRRRRPAGQRPAGSRRVGAGR